MKVKKILNEGKRMTYENDYRNALNEFRTVLSIDSANATANFRVAQCHFNLGKPRLGKRYALKALSLDTEVNKDVHYVLAGSYHQLGDLSNAKKHYKIFKSKAKKKTNEDYDTEKLIEQCIKAEKLIKNPVNAKIENLGRNINSFNPEYSVSISADGKTMVFTSRRADTKGGLVDTESDNLYFEDIYISHWIDSLNEWSKSEPVKGEVNTPGHDAVMSLSPNGESMYVFHSTRLKSGDIFVSTKKQDSLGNESFGEIVTADKGRNINSTYFESSASVSRDGNTMYFVSDRPGGKGQADIYRCERTSNGWSKPVNLGDSINSESDEISVFIHPSGQYLFFSSNNLNSIGSYDIFVSKKVGGVWSGAVNLGYPINTVRAEKTISVTRDLKSAYISANYKGSYGSTDIYHIDISNLDIFK
ncbi:MAG: hypothetical protein ACPGVD_05430 [Flavobacteriales bacterium]